VIDVESDPAAYRETLKAQWASLRLHPQQVALNMDLIALGVPNDPNSRELSRIRHQPLPRRWEWVGNVVTQCQSGLVVIDTALSFSPFKAGDEEKTRLMFSWISAILRVPPYPAVLLAVHLRKQDRQRGSTTPTLLEDPHGWTEEILGSIVWSASADVRLGLERIEDDRVVFAGFRRGLGEINPLIIEPRIEGDGEQSRVAAWQLCSASDIALRVLTPKQRDYFFRLPVGERLTWDQLLRTAEIAKGSASRLIERASATGLLERDTVAGTFMRCK
jgi:hypothetical protein